MRTKIQISKSVKTEVEIEFPYYTTGDFSDRDFTSHVYTRHFPDRHVSIHESVYPDKKLFEIEQETGHGLYLESSWQRPSTAQEFSDAWNRARAFFEKVLAEK